jgi:hypothetical protein
MTIQSVAVRAIFVLLRETRAAHVRMARLLYCDIGQKIAEKWNVVFYFQCIDFPVFCKGSGRGSAAPKGIF